ncbi:hypothetical protein Ndes2526B_g05007 [Nannochloris sp. 'desiccata']
MQAAATTSHVQARAMPRNAAFVTHTRKMRISNVALRRPLHVCAAADQEPNNQQEQKPKVDSTDPVSNPPRVNAVPDPSIARGQTTAILTGAISIIFGVAYLALVQFMDMRGGELLPPPPEAFIP